MIIQNMRMWDVNILIPILFHVHRGGDGITLPKITKCDDIRRQKKPSHSVPSWGGGLCRHTLPPLPPLSPDSDSSTTWTHKLQEKPSALYREHPALQNMKILYFFPYLWVILPSWIRIRIRIQNVDPDSDQQNNFIRIQWIWIWN